jgi:hypothetical protein
MPLYNMPKRKQIVLLTTLVALLINISNGEAAGAAVAGVDIHAYKMFQSQISSSA